VSSIGSPSFRSLSEFRCPSCGGQKAYRSRYRRLLEQVFLIPLMLKPVRCERCFHRTYVFRSVQVMETHAASKELNRHSSGDPGAGSRVA